MPKDSNVVARVLPLDTFSYSLDQLHTTISKSSTSEEFPN